MDLIEFEYDEKNEIVKEMMLFNESEMIDEFKKLYKRRNQKRGLQRDDIDKFYTSSATASLCVDLFQKYVVLDSNDLIVEPCAGDGVFMDELNNICNNCMYLDIIPDNKGIKKQDFFKFDTDNIVNDYINETKHQCNNRVHVISNPPFGRQSTSAIKFIKKSCKFADTISFILPKSFKKDSMKKTFDIMFHLVHQIDIAPNSFLINGKICDIPCIYQIWVKKNKKRSIPKVLEPNGFKFVKGDDSSSHISFRRVGGTAGYVSRDINKSVQSHYFIKFNNKNKCTNALINKMNKIKYDTDNTVGPRSISKQELIVKFNKII
jgi:hypothetical protein